MRAWIKEKLFGFFVVLFVMTLATSPALAGFIDFENGVDGRPIRSTIPGLEFTTTDGWDWLYADWRTGNYCGPYPYNPDPWVCGELYYSHGNFFAWLGASQGRGIITFTASYATYFQIGYSAYYGLYLEAYDHQNRLLDSAYGPPNTNTGRLDILRVEGPGMAYVIVHDTGNYWLVDDLETDAIQECLVDADCDDGVFCNGQETCQQFICWEATTPVNCPDDGLFCNGTEFCDEEADQCDHTGDPCPEGTTCNEQTDTCDKDGDGGGGGDDFADEEVGVKSVGGCGC